jgi:peptide/nickel transport system substrate-binding protein
MKIKYLLMCLAGCFFLLLMFNPAFPKDIRVGHQQDIIQLDPARVNMSGDRTIVQNVYQGLIEFDYAGKKLPLPLRPVLAEKYEVASDGKSITFHLRKGVKLHHGYGEFTSEDVKFSILRHKDPKTKSNVKEMFGIVAAVETPDKHTAKVIFDEPYAQTFLGSLAWQDGYMVSKKAFEALGEKAVSFPVGTGPWEFESWNPRREIILRKFKDYYGKKPGFDRIVFKIVVEMAASLAALEAGDLDVLTLSQRGSRQLVSRIKGVNISESAGAMEQQYLYLQMKETAPSYKKYDKPLTKLKVRQALAHAINYEELNKSLGSDAHFFGSPFSEIVFGATGKFWKYEYDLKKAKQLMEEAGYKKPIDLVVIYYPKIMYFEPMALQLKHYWDEVGKLANVILTSIERANYWAKVKAGDWDVSCWGVARMTPYLYSDFLKTGSTRNYVGLRNSQLDALVEKASTAPTMEVSREAWEGVQKIAVENLPMIWPASIIASVAVRQGITGVVPLPMFDLIDLDDAREQ